MLKPPAAGRHQTTRPEITALFDSAKLVLDETPKAVSPFGGLASFICFLGSIGFAQKVQTQPPFAEPSSNNAIPLAHSLTAFLISVVVGAKRFAHTEWWRADRVLPALLGMERFPSDDTVRNFFRRFTQAHIEAFWRPLWGWLLRLVKCPTAGFALDLDSMVFGREGTQEGALKGFNPRHRGRPSHLPLVAVLAEAQFTPSAPYRQPGTLRVLGTMGRQTVIKLSAAWGWAKQIQAFGGSHLDLEKLPFAEVDSTRRSPGHWRGHDLKT